MDIVRHCVLFSGCIPSFKYISFIRFDHKTFSVGVTNINDLWVSEPHLTDSQIINVCDNYICHTQQPLSFCIENVTNDTLKAKISGIPKEFVLHKVHSNSKSEILSVLIYEMAAKLDSQEIIIRNLKNGDLSVDKGNHVFKESPLKTGMSVLNPGSKRRFGVRKITFGDDSPA